MRKITLCLVLIFTHCQSCDDALKMLRNSRVNKIEVCAKAFEENVLMYQSDFNRHKDELEKFCTLWNASSQRDRINLDHFAVNYKRFLGGERIKECTSFSLNMIMELTKNHLRSNVRVEVAYREISLTHGKKDFSCVKYYQQRI